MRKDLLVTITFLTIIFFVTTPFVSAQKKKSGRGYVSSIQQEAEDQAQYLWSSYIIRCGEDYYARDRDQIYHFKNAQITVSPNLLTRADRLNQVGYSGHTYFRVGQTRVFSRYPRNYQNAGWSQWYNGFRTPRGSFSLTMSLSKTVGHWDAEPNSTSQLNNLQPIDCRDKYGDGDFDDWNGSSDRDYDPSNRNDYSSNWNNRSRRDGNSNNRDNNNNWNNNSNNRDDNYNGNNNFDTRNNNSYNGVNWVRMTRGQSLPYNAIAGGVEVGGDSNGAALHVCRAAYNGNWHPGKLLNGSCSIGYGGKEIVFSTYEAATGSGNWSKANASYSGALIGGRETGRSLYVCRANFRESTSAGTINYGQYPGKVVDGRCNFAFGTKELSSNDFNVFYPNSDSSYSH